MTLSHFKPPPMRLRLAGLIAMSGLILSVLMLYLGGPMVRFCHPSGLFILPPAICASALSVFEIAAAFDLIPRPDDLLQLFFLGPIAAVHIGVEHFDQQFIGLANFGF